MPEVHPGSEEGLSDGSHKQSCATIPPQCHLGKGHRESLWVFPTQHGAASESPELVHLMVLCVQCWAGGTPVCLHAWAPSPHFPCGGAGTQQKSQLAQAASMPHRDHRAPAWSKGPAQVSPGGLQQSKHPISVRPSQCLVRAEAA